MITNWKRRLALRALSWLWVLPVFIFTSTGNITGVGWVVITFLGLLWAGGVYLQVHSAWKWARQFGPRTIISAWFMRIAWPHLADRAGLVDGDDNGPELDAVEAAHGGWTALLRTFNHDRELSGLKSHRGHLGRTLGVKELEVRDLGTSITLRAYFDDPLASKLAWSAVPKGSCARDEDGRNVDWPRFHTLVAGATGSGKGSAIWGIIGPEIRSGRPMKFYGCDPKMSEFAGPVESVFESVAFDSEPIAEMLQTVRDLMKERRGQGRDFVQSQENPLIILAIDELPSLYGGMDSKQAKAAANNLDEILRQGRSLGVIVVSATQEVTKEIVSARNSYGWRIALRLERAEEVTMLLGQGAVEEGARPHEIAPATPSNGYATAGVGWVRSDSSGLVRARFPYTSDDDLEQLAAFRAVS
ncbi:FtsK/SpoIIIE family protein [Brevibacterium sandarakinum]|uniref:FtsK/SpoIIIE family protein n=1 Tax=Brevibacterium sandarakinum TaxID=629680 RepID=A0A1H1MXR1_BRESA|nr:MULTISPECIES: FtsK/SpoIIIE domain-containing protein [Brevibacterium]SDR90729.1 FtsK/SpoIIIE family protein [Brevibacterium sandarakinum]